MPTDTDVAWAAGLFEGEGCIFLSARKDSNGMNRALVMTSTDLDVITRFAEIVGAGRIRTGNNELNPRWKRNYEWRVTLWADIERILLMLRPWFGERRGAKADLLLANPAGPKGRQGQTHCKRNHPLAGEGADVYVYRRDHLTVRRCRHCDRIRKELKA